MATALDSYAPYDSGAGADVTEDTWRAFMRHMRGSSFGDGVLRTASTAFEVYADSTGMQVKVRVGECWIRGQWGQITAEKTQAIATAHGTLARKDRIILRNDFTLNRIEIDVLTGTAGAGVAPSLTQTTAKWEIGLAIVDVPALDTSIDAGQVSDNRTWIDNPGPSARKASNKTVNNSTTFSDDTELVALLGANATYALDTFLIYSADPNADVKFTFSGPTGLAGSVSPWGSTNLASATNIVSVDVGINTPTATYPMASGGAVGSQMSCRLVGIVRTGEAGGTLTLRFAQNTAHASNAVLYTDSWIRATRIALSTAREN